MKKLLQIDPEELLDDIKELTADEVGRVIYCLCHKDDSFRSKLIWSDSMAVVYGKWRERLYPKTFPVKAIDWRVTHIIGYLNTIYKSKFRDSSKTNQAVIMARLNEGYTIEEFERVIDVKVAKWSVDKKMISFIRPETLFGNKFEGYVNEKIAPVSKFEQTAHSVASASMSLKEKFANDRINKNRPE